MNTTTRSKQLPFPTWVDNTLLKAFRSCDRKAYWEGFRKQTLKGGNVHLHAGGAFAHGLEVARRAFFEQGVAHDDAVALGLEALIKAYGTFETPDSSAKSWERMSGALDFYFQEWPMNTDAVQPLTIEGKRTVEFSFSTAIPGTHHPSTGEPILYAGRTDMIGAYEGANFIVDEKTTSQLGATWASQWQIQSQFKGYTWSAQQYGYDVTGSIIRGIAIRKTGYDKAEAIVYHTKREIDEWLCQTQRTLDRMIESWRRGEWHMNLGDVCSAYGGCGFRALCEAPDPEPYLGIYYEPRDWNPLHK